MVAHWSFNEGNGTIATDCSGNGHHGTVQNATWVENQGRRALDFNGTSSTVILPEATFDTLSDQVSIALWTYGDPDGLPKESSVFYAHNGNNRVLNIHLPWSDSQIFWDAPDRINSSANEAEFEGSWAHWVFTKSATSGIINIYRNGKLWHTGTNANSAIGNITGGRIGSQLNTRFYDGMIDEIQLYNIALTANEVADLFESSTLSGLIGDVQITTTKSDTPPTVSNTDLAQTHYLNSSATGGEAVKTRHAELFNGIIGDNSSGTGDIGVVRMNNENTLTIELDTSINTLGYNISAINSVFGWNPDGGGRSNQGYEIILTFVDDTTATLAGPSHWEPNDPASFWTTLSFNSATGTHMASGVKAITFDITENANANGIVIAREFDISGTPTRSIDQEQVFAADESLDVHITAPTGSPGTDWDHYIFDCTLVLDTSATSSHPFTFNLNTATLPSFDATQDHAWLIVTAEQIIGTFDPSAFIVDPSNFEANNPTNGGQFVITQAASKLFLTFTAVERSALEEWRLTHFGTYENSGNTADDFDADFDGVANLIEYATGLNPNDANDSVALKIRVSLSNPDQLEVSFNRIEDASLTYTLEGSDSLELGDWDPLLSTTGSEEGTIIVPESSWPDFRNYFFRLQVTY